jgi:hypothetical protein
VVGMQHYFAAKTVLSLDILNGFEDQSHASTDGIKVIYLSHC